MNSKNFSRLRRAKKTRIKIRNQDTPRLTIYRSSKHFYAQVFDCLGSKVIVSASTAEKDLKIKIEEDQIIIFSYKSSKKDLQNFIKACCDGYIADLNNENKDTKFYFSNTNCLYVFDFWYRDYWFGLQVRP